MQDTKNKEEKKHLLVSVSDSPDVLFQSPIRKDKEDDDKHHKSNICEAIRSIFKCGK
jgi:hypothetical protein